MKHWVKHIVAAGLAVAVIGAGLAATQPAYADPVNDRRAAMKQISKANKVLRKAAKAGKQAAAKRQARIIIASVNKVSAAGIWPRGTDRKAMGARATRAKAGIWKDWGAFEKKFGALKKAASAVAGGNMAAAKRIGKACGSCHKAYRGKKAKKKRKM